ncbi:hypothetical protein BZA05DRAFT_201761 [Tricharina praecox]|uniref:uncharacterized protein n=1 Tax=Tricharina praecox TaxID=43433 RepID=UPI002220CF72|nr:uncharacterized protein BZA05DRAFT_201761 [Tricharina praecox]KAI5856468.1 hypothetical protein BZA05DRAFT_201761 [Tricharina praecox]
MISALGLNQRGRHPSITQHSHMRGQDSVASTSPQISSLRQAAQAAILDMSLCGVKYDDLIREGYDPVVLGRLFASAGLPVVMNSIPPPSAPPSNEQGSSAPPKVAATKLNRPLPTEKGVLDKDAQVLREKLEKARLDHEKRERREKEQKEAEARASELVRRRQAATEEEERRRREVEVKAKQDIAKKKIATMMSAAKPASPGVPTTIKAASPSVPPTPISSTPVNAAVAAAKPQPNPPAASPSPPMVIPGLLLAPASGTASEVASKAASEVASRAASEATSKATSKAATPESTDVVMSDAPQVAVSNPPSIAAVPTVGAGSNGVSPPQPPPAARRKRPMASDLYSEPNPVRRKFGAQRTSSMIIEVSDDEDDAADATYFTPHESREDQGSPLGTPGIASNGLNHGVRRIVSLPVTAATSQADELRKREADIQRMKARIMAAEQKSMAAQRRKELSKAASNSGHPTPIGTPTVGSDSSAPPPLTTQLAGKHDSVMPTAPPAGLTNDTPIENQRPDVSKKTEMDLEAQQIRARAIEERMRKHREEIAAAEKKKKEEVESAAVNAAAVKAAEAKAAETKKKEEEREKKRRELVALENRRQNKRLEREMLEEQLRRQIAEMRREEEDMEQRHDSLVRDLEDVNIPLQPVAPSNDMQNGSEQMRTEIEAKEKNEGQSPIRTPDIRSRKKIAYLIIGPSGSEELVERQLLVEDVSNSSGNPTPASATASALEGHSQFIGRPEEIVAVAKSLSPVKVAPTAVLKTVDSMDVDESHELATQDKPAPAEDVEMESSCADGTSFGETSGSDDSSDDSSSEEGDEDKDEVMVDKPEETQSNATIQTAVSVSDALPIQTAQPIAPSSPMETNAPTTELASEPARANEPFVVTVPEVALKV